MKKYLAILLVLALVGTALCGCGALPTAESEEPAAEKPAEQPAQTAQETEPESTEPTECVIRVLDYCDSSAAPREVFHKEFEAAHPGVTIEYTCTTADQLQNILVTSLGSDQAPDVFMLPEGIGLSAAFAENMVEQLDAYESMQNVKGTFNEGMFIEGITTMNGNLYAIPEQQAIISTLLFYNQDVLDAAGVTALPTNWDEFAAVCKQISDNTTSYGLIEGGTTMWRVDSLIRSFAQVAGAKITNNGGTPITVDGRADYDSEAVVKTMKFFQQLAQDGSIHPDSLTIAAPVAREMFAQGEAAFINQGMFNIGAWAGSYPDLNYGVMAIPSPDGTPGYQAKGVWSTNGYVVNAGSQNKEMAVEYLACMFSDEYSYQRECVGAGTWLSIVPEYNDKYLTNETSKQYYTLENESSRVFPDASLRDASAVAAFKAQVVDVEPDLWNILQGVLSGSVTDIEGALKNLSDTATTEWKRAAEAAGIDYGVFEFPNWVLGENYTADQYAELG